MADIQRQELACTNCRRTFRFSLDFDNDGCHEIACPGCRHIHYRVIKNGRITEERYRSSMQSYYASNYYMSTGTSSTTDWAITGTGSGGTTCGTGSGFIRDSWLNSTSTA